MTVRGAVSMGGASEGVIRLYYVEELGKLAEWAIPSLLCVEHGANDGLLTSTEGMQHSVLVKVPVGLMDKAREYRFVISAKDSHADREKGHREKWALERNQQAEEYRARTHGFSNWLYPPGETASRAKHAKEALERGGQFLSYFANDRRGDTIRRYMTQANVFFYFGHQQYNDGGALVFPVGDTLRHLYAEYRGFFPPDYDWEWGDAFLKLGRQANGDYYPPPPHDPNVLRDGALSRLGLAIYEGCNTANDNPNVGSLLSASVTLGVGYAVGWTRTIYGGKYHPGNGHPGARVDNDPAHLWADEFWRAWCYDTNADGSPLNVMQAHDRAMRYVRDHCYARYRDPGETDPLGNMGSIAEASRSGVPGDGPTRDSIKGR